MATRDPSAVEQDLVTLVRELSRRTGHLADETETRAALAGLSAPEVLGLRKALRGSPPARPLGPFAWVDVVRGVEPQVAAARELSGYYSLLAERDALASLLQSRGPAQAHPSAQALEPRQPQPPAAPAKPKTRGAVRSDPQALPAIAPRRSPPARQARGRQLETKERRTFPAAREEPASSAPPSQQPEPQRSAADDSARAGNLLGLFAYHRDSTLVAQALRISLAELNGEVELLKLRRKVARLVRGFDVDLPAATPLGAARSGPPVRRRAADKGTPRVAVERPGDELRKLLAELGPRRRALAARLGPPDQPLTDKELLALFAAASLERSLANGERELLRELFLTHRGARGPIAAELGLSPAQLKDLIVERGLARELDGLRERFKRDAREKKWPEGRIELLLHERPLLQELGLLPELEREVKTRVQLLWKSLKARPHALEDLQRELRITADDARTLQRLCELRR